jgi:aromatic-L-amino-acid/L-tryptophan decarboxylase
VCPCPRTAAGSGRSSRTWPRRSSRTNGWPPRLELLLEPELSIVCFRYAASDAVNAEILLRLRRTTRSIPSSTVVKGQLAIRPCFINPHTELADVDALVDHVAAIGDGLTGTRPD